MTAQERFDSYVREVYACDLAQHHPDMYVQLRAAFFSGITAAVAHGPQLMYDVAAYVQAGMASDGKVH